MIKFSDGVRRGYASTVAAAILIAGSAGSQTAIASEILYAPFSKSGGVATKGLYSGDVWVTVSGAGQAFANNYSDAFYMLRGPVNNGPPAQFGFWDLGFGTSPLASNNSVEAVKSLVGPVPAYRNDSVYTFQLHTGAASPTHLYFGAADDLFSDNAGAYTVVVGSQPTEVVYAPFSKAGGVETTGAYYGRIRVTVSGVGQAFADNYSDAFYMMTGSVNSGPPTQFGFWDLGFGTSPIPTDGSEEASKSLVGPIPVYSPDNVYTFELDTKTSVPTHLFFGANDEVFSDNSGAYTIAITQIAAAPEPSTWVMLIAGFAGLGLYGRRVYARTPVPDAG